VLLLSAPPDCFQLPSADVVTSVWIIREPAVAQVNAVLPAQQWQWGRPSAGMPPCFSGYNSPVPAAAPALPVWSRELTARCAGFWEEQGFSIA